MAKTFDEIEGEHNTRDDCWLILYGNVYDVTAFLPEHPGGLDIILRYGGTDATSEYDPIHQNGTLERNLNPSAKLGQIRPNSSKKDKKALNQSRKSNVDLRTLVNLEDFEKAAEKNVPPRGLAYYFSGSDDLVTKIHNNKVYRQIYLRPRIFINVDRYDASTTLLGFKVGLPVYISPAARARLGHPSGEHGIAKAASKFGALQIISNHASMTMEEIVVNAPPDQIFGWQIYVQKDRRKSEALLNRVHALPAIKFIVVTLDVPTITRREMEERLSETGVDLGHVSPSQGSSVFGGVNQGVRDGKASDLTWDTTLSWLEKYTHLPIVLKGVQTHEDAILAMRYPRVKAIILSNHGGRALDTAPPPVHVLLELRHFCPEVFDRLEVWVDGGIKRGTDVIKAICLGAKAVGIGRAALYGLAAGGIAGVERTLQILKTEVELTMRLLGVERLDQLGTQYLNTSVVERDIYKDNKAWNVPKARL